MKEFAGVFTKEQWETIAYSLSLRADLLEHDCIDNNAGDREWNKVWELRDLVRSIEYIIIGD